MKAQMALFNKLRHTSMYNWELRSTEPSFNLVVYCTAACISYKVD